MGRNIKKGSMERRDRNVLQKCHEFGIKRKVKGGGKNEVSSVMGNSSHSGAGIGTVKETHDGPDHRKQQ